MIKNQGRQILAGEDADLDGIVRCLRHALGPGNKDGGDGVQPGIPARVRVAVQLTAQGNIKTGFLFCLAHRGSFQAFPVIDETTGNSPAIGRITAFDENDAVAKLDDDVNGGGRITRGWPRTRIRSRIHGR